MCGPIVQFWRSVDVFSYKQWDRTEIPGEVDKHVLDKSPIDMRAR